MTLPPASPAQTAAERSDHIAVALEKPMPAPETPERDRHDQRHREICTGLLNGYRRHAREAKTGAWGVEGVRPLPNGGG